MEGYSHGNITTKTMTIARARLTKVNCIHALAFYELNVSTVQGVLLIDDREVHGHEHRWPNLIMLF